MLRVRPRADKHYNGDKLFFVKTYNLVQYNLVLPTKYVKISTIMDKMYYSNRRKIMKVHVPRKTMHQF